MQTCYIELKQKRYPIYIGVELLTQPQLLQKHIHGKQLLIISNTTVAKIYLEKLQAVCQSYQCDALVLPDGEIYKTLDTTQRIFDVLVAHKHTRTTTLLALGGGVIGDMTGFAAACYMRGVNYIQLPTTLLAQVDAAIGGKTAVNHPQGKNLIGAFYQPHCVISDINTLQTLPAREFHVGFAEIIKYGLIQDKGFFEWLEAHMPALLAKQPDALIQAITRCCAIKAGIVAEDERELTGVRALLNFGHTFAHAIETATQYDTLLHGEAVAIGMLIATELSVRMGWLSEEVTVRLCKLLTQVGLPVRLPANLSVTNLLTLMQGDKKNINLQLRLILLKDIGHATIAEGINLDKIQQVLEKYQT